MAWKAKTLQQGQINEACHSTNGLQPNPSASSASALYYEDITQKRQKARFCLSFLSSLVEGMMDTVLVVNPKTGLIEYANKAALRMFDCQFEDLINHPPDIFCPLETRLKFHEEIIRDSLKENGWEGEVKSVRKSGDPFASWLRSFSLKDEDGLTWMTVIVQRNLTAEKSFNEQLANEQLVNKHLANEQLKNKHLAKEQLANEKLKNKHLVNEHLANEHLANEHLANEQLANEHLANEQLANEHLANEHLANEQLANEHLAQAVKLSAVEQRSRETAHELNNLTTILYGYIDFMLMKEGLPSDLEKDLKAIQSIGKRATLIARQLLNPRQFQERKKAITELSPLIRETLQIVSKEFNKQGIQTEIIHHQPISLLLDPAQISQVLLNLCINAQHAMAEAPRKILHIETGQDAGFAFLKISDTGCGISKENQDKIFQPFFTTKRRPITSGEKGSGNDSGNDSDNGSGNGLGLTVVKKIIEDHGGSIEVQSSIGEGTAFIIYLPLPVPDLSQTETPSQTPHASHTSQTSHASQTSHTSLTPHTTRTKTSHFQGKTILIVDDEYSIRQLVKKALELQGARVDAAGAGGEGFEMILQKKYDLVLMDLQLQDMSGEKLMDLINSIPEPVRPVKMVMSGRAGDMSQRLMNGFDVSAVLCKPFELDDLYTKISAVLGNQ